MENEEVGTTVSWNEGEYYDAAFGINKNRRYHALLSGYYQAVYNWTVGLNAFAGSGAFVAILARAPIWASGTLSGVFAFAAVLESIFRYEHRARAHHDLCVRFTKLAAELERLSPTPENLKKVRARRIEIEADEPGVKRLVEIRAVNEEARARGVPEAQLTRLSWMQWWLGPVFTFGLRRLEQEKAARQKAPDLAAT
jgi:hypothetical protein